MSKPIEHRVRAVTRFVVTQHEAGRTQEVGEFPALELASGVAAALALARRERGDDAVFIPFEAPPPGKVMRCKAVLAAKTPNVQILYYDPPGRKIEVEHSGGTYTTADPADPANYRQDGVNVAFHAVWGGQDPDDGKNACRENRIFADATPSLTFTATIRNPAVTDRLEVGGEYYVDFIPAPKAEVAS